MPESQIKGLPAGAELRPISGLPPGAELRPVGQQGAPLNASTDPSGRTPSGEPAPGDNRNMLQRAFDNMVTPDPRREEWQNPVKTGVDRFSMGVAGNVLPLIAHPLKSIGGAVSSVGHALANNPGNPVGAGLDLVRPMIESGVENYQQNGPAKAIPQMLGQGVGMWATGEVGGGVAAPIARGIARTVAPTLERVGLGLGNDVLGAKGAKPFKYDANPARGAYEEGVLPAMSKHSAAMNLEKALPQVGQRISDKVMSGGSAPSSDIAHSIEQPIQDAGNVMAGFGGGKPLDPVTNLWASMEEKAPNASTPIYGNSAPENVPAPDLWHSIRNLDKNTRFNPDPEVEGVNELRRDIRGGLRGNLEDAVPGLKPETQRYSDLKSAEGSLDRTMHGGMTLNKMLTIPMTPIESTAGAALYRSGKMASRIAKSRGSVPLPVIPQPQKKKEQ